MRGGGGEALRQLQDSGLEKLISACQITLKAKMESGYFRFYAEWLV